MSANDPTTELAGFNEHVIACLKAGVPLDLGIPGPAQRTIRFLESHREAGASRQRDDWPDRYRRAIEKLDGGGGNVEALMVLKVPGDELSLRRASNERWIGWAGMAALALVGFGILVIQVVPQLTDFYRQVGLETPVFAEWLEWFGRRFPIFLIATAVLLFALMLWRLRWFEPLYRGSSEVRVGSDGLPVHSSLATDRAVVGSDASDSEGAGSEVIGSASEGSSDLAADPRRVSWAEQLHAARSATRRRRRLRWRSASEILFTVFVSGGLVFALGWSMFYIFATLLHDLAAVGAG